MALTGIYVARRIATGAALVLLIGAFTFQLVGTLREVPQPRTRPRMGSQVQTFIPGWQVADQPLGATEASSEGALKMLNLDDYVYRRFRRGSEYFTVYAGYWAKGRMPTRLVASHTPDRCWTENGMRCVDMRFRQLYHLGSGSLAPGEYRAFVSPTSEGKIHVVYWHMVDGHNYDYGERFNAIPHPWLWWKDLVAQAAFGSREQVFVRIASSMPIEALWKEPGFQEVMLKVADFGLWMPVPKN